jgi:transposase-like protein
MSHVAVYKWIKKYVGLMQNYLDKIKPNVGDAWRTDELFLKVKGDMKYLYALMDDDETRFWIAQQVADTKYTATSMNFSSSCVCLQIARCYMAKRLPM